MLAPAATWRFPAKAAPLFVPVPYKVMYGGRAGGKSWAAARALLHLACQRKLFILCAREIQKSIAESVYKLLVDQIDAMGLAHVYDVKSSSISNTETGSRFVFAGVRNNITAIKSMEAIDICWVEEAEKVSGHSWGILLPTIRRDAPYGPFGRGSEVWVVFNPELERDFTYQYWVLGPPQPVYRFEIGDDGDVQAALRRLKAAKPTTVQMEMNYHDNEWFADYSRKQLEHLKATDYESYLTVWEGKVRRVIKGAIYAKELEKAQADGRISGTVEIDRAKPVSIGVDLGRSDMTTLWFMQQVGMQHHAVDYYGNFGFDWSHYLEQIQARKYVIGRIYLPHDAKNKHVDAKKSVYQQTRDAYPGDGRVIVVPRTPSVANDINAVRLIFPRLWFNEKLCSDGLHGLAHYRYEVDAEDSRDISEQPLHDWACVTAETQVLTKDGMKAISALPETGEVLTPCGWKNYRLPRMTRRSAPLVEVAFADGLRVNCTAEHLFLTENGWKSAASLQRGMLIRSSLTLSRSISMASSIGYGRARVTLLAEAAISISTCGKRFLEYARRVCISTTEMMSRVITGLEISKACPARSISNSPISDDLLRERSQIHLVLRPDAGLLIGIALLLACFGTRDMRSGAAGGSSGDARPRGVWGAVWNIRRLFAPMAAARNTVPRYANRPIEVASVTPLDRHDDVWCLTVDDGAWWTLANGAVTHNSHPADGLRTYVMGLRDDSTRGKPQMHMPQGLPRGEPGEHGWMRL